MGTRRPVSAKTSSPWGLAVIALDFASVVTWPRHRPCAEAHARTLWIAALSATVSTVWRRVVPSIAMPSPGRTAASVRTHARQAVVKAAGSSAAKTRPTVSCDGRP